MLGVGHEGRFNLNNFWKCYYIKWSNELLYLKVAWLLVGFCCNHKCIKTEVFPLCSFSDQYENRKSLFCYCTVLNRHTFAKSEIKEPCSAINFPKTLLLRALRAISCMPRSAAPISLMQWCNLPGPSLPCKNSNYNTKLQWDSKPCKYWYHDQGFIEGQWVIHYLGNFKSTPFSQ